ncbi:MAG: transaldolase family protein, partial [Corynebacterium sp.]|nr:transaldolase family protein [Corynebacterium sp.]
MNHIEELLDIGTSCWLDDLSRERLDSGNLEELIRTKGVVGVTTNPAIFAAAMTKSTAYDAQLAKLRSEGAKAERAVY